MYLMVEFRCVKCEDKEYGIVYYEKVFPSEFLSIRGWVQMTALLLRRSVWLQESNPLLSVASVSVQTVISHSCSPFGSCDSGSQNSISMQVIKAF